MKTLGWIAAMFFSHSVVAATEVHLVITFQPDSKYLVERYATNEMQFEMPDELVEAESGDGETLEASQELIIKQDFIQSVETGEKRADGGYPLSVSVQTNQQLLSIDGSEFMPMDDSRQSLEGLVMLGEVNADGNFIYKSMTGVETQPEFEKVMQSLFEQMSSSNLMMGKTVSLGETVTFSQPLNLPVADIAVLEIDLRMHYTLVSIEFGMAYFDIEFDMVLTSEVESFSMDMYGTGNGNMTYDIEKQIAPITETEMTINVAALAEDHMFRMKVRNKETALTTKIE